MGTVAVALGLALVVGLAAGGSLRRLLHLRLRSAWLVGAALGAQVAGGLTGLVSSAAAGPAYSAGLVVSAVLALVFLVRNAWLAGTELVTAGLLLNAVVIGLNGAMPVSPEAARRAGVVLDDVAQGRDARHELTVPGTRLRFLGDVVPVPLPLRAEVVSPGDLMAATGLALMLITALRPPVGRYERRRPER